MFYFNKSGRKNLNHLREDVDYWHRPERVFFEVFETMIKKGVVEYNKLEKGYIEMLAGALFLTIMKDAEGKDFWIAKTKSDPPDFAFMTMVEYKEGFSLNSREVEVTRNIYSVEQLEKTLMEKDVPYPRDTAILCYVESPGTLDLRILSEKLKSQIKHIDCVFVIFHGTLIDEVKNRTVEELSNVVSLTQLLPEYITHTKEINIVSEINNSTKHVEKIIYVKEGKVYYGLKEGDEKYPNIFSENI